MSNPYFKFQQFTVFHDQCAMKVGTDGVLLGAWAPVETCHRVLDIGCGSGVISLMVAQRNTDATIDAIDIDESAVRQSNDNFAQSPWSDRLHAMQADVREYVCDGMYDCIVCNPPFFSEDTLPPDESRAMARNSNTLTFQSLIIAAERLLTSDGVLCVIIPTWEIGRFVEACLAVGLHLAQRTYVRTVPRKQPKRVLLSFSRHSTATLKESEITLQNPDGSRSLQYQSLAKDFYL